MPTSFSPVEILVVLVVALIVLGPNRLPQAGRQVGRAIAEMKRWSRGIQNEIRDVIDTDFEPPRSTSASTPSTPASPPAGTESPSPPAPTNGSAIAGDEPPRN